MRRHVAMLCVAAIAWLGAAEPPEAIDPQTVLARYGAALDALATPKAQIFTFVVSQAGPVQIEQRHLIYRSGSKVRDETLAVNNVGLKQKIVRIEQRTDRYAVERIAPREPRYDVRFERAAKAEGTYVYVFSTTPLASVGRFVVDEITIDGRTFLPRSIRFHSIGSSAHGTGTITYSGFGPYWMPVLATVSASVEGKPARERLAWSDYRFPPNLPPSTFQSPRPLPAATLPPI